MLPLRFFFNFFLFPPVACSYHYYYCYSIRPGHVSIRNDGRWQISSVVTFFYYRHGRRDQRHHHLQDRTNYDSSAPSLLSSSKPMQMIMLIVHYLQSQDDLTVNDHLAILGHGQVIHHRPHRYAVTEHGSVHLHRRGRRRRRRCRFGSFLFSSSYCYGCSHCYNPHPTLYGPKHVLAMIKNIPQTMPINAKLPAETQSRGYNS